MFGRKPKMKPIGAGYLTRRDNDGNEMFTVRTVIYKEGSDTIAMCLENSLVGVSDSEDKALKSLIMSIEADLYYRANSDSTFEVIKAEDSYEMMFIDILRKHHTSAANVKKPLLNEIAKRFKDAFAIDNYDTCAHKYLIANPVC